MHILAGQFWSETKNDNEDVVLLRQGGVMKLQPKNVQPLRGSTPFEHFFVVRRSQCKALHRSSLLELFSNLCFQNMHYLCNIQ
jgi:hypothetical protein